MSPAAGWNEIPKDMARIQEILQHEEFRKAMEWIDVLEKERIFCGHGMGHLLDVARIAWIDNLEQEAGFRKMWSMQRGFSMMWENIFNIKRESLIIFPAKSWLGRFLRIRGLRQMKRNSSVRQF